MHHALNPSKFLLLTTLFATLAAGLTGCTTSKGDTAAEKRDYVDLMVRSSLKEFYRSDPEIEPAVRDSAGYGLFSSIGTNIIFVATDAGYGKVHESSSGTDTYMKLRGGGIGLGIGAKDYKLLMVFKTQDALRDFINNGWSAEAEADVAAKSGDQGGAKSAGENTAGSVDTYLLTENGLAIGATIGATKFYRDDELN